MSRWNYVCSSRSDSVADASGNELPPHAAVAVHNATVDQLEAARATLRRIAEAMGCEPDDDDDLVEAVRMLVRERDSVLAERDRSRATVAETREILAAYDHETVQQAASRMVREEAQSFNAAAVARANLHQAVADARVDMTRERDAALADADSMRELAWRWCLKARTEADGADVAR